MDRFIEDRDGTAWIDNPTDPEENFADKWAEHPELQDAFYEWLEQARDDFELVASAFSASNLSEYLAPRLGSKLVNEVLRGAGEPGVALLSSQNSPVTIRSVPQVIEEAPHRQVPKWLSSRQPIGTVEIVKSTVKRAGFRDSKFRSGDTALSKHCKLHFKAKTSVPRPYRVYWQVVNTGDEAISADCLRGDFFENSVEKGTLTRKESTLYRGQHSIECFIVKDEVMAARSGSFVVNIL